MCLFILQTSTPHKLTAAAETHTEHYQLPHVHIHSCTCRCNNTFTLYLKILPQRFYVNISTTTTTTTITTTTINTANNVTNNAATTIAISTIATPNPTHVDIITSNTAALTTTNTNTNAELQEKLIFATDVNGNELLVDTVKGTEKEV